MDRPAANSTNVPACPQSIKPSLYPQSIVALCRRTIHSPITSSSLLQQYNVVDISIIPRPCRHNVLNTSVCSSNDIWKTSEPILIHVTPRQSTGRGRDILEVRRSKFKVTRGRKYIWRRDGSIILNPLGRVPFLVVDIVVKCIPVNIS